MLVAESLMCLVPGHGVEGEDEGHEAEAAKAQSRRLVAAALRRRSLEREDGDGLGGGAVAERGVRGERVAQGL